MLASNYREERQLWEIMNISVDGEVQYDELADFSPVDSSSVWEVCAVDDFASVVNVKEELEANGSYEDLPPWGIAAQMNCPSAPMPRKSKRNFRDILREVTVSEETLQFAVARLGGGTQGLQVLMDHVNYWASDSHDEDVTATIRKGIVDLGMPPAPKRHCNPGSTNGDANVRGPYLDAQWKNASRGTCETTNYGAAYTRALRKSHIVRQRGQTRAQRHHSISKSCGHQSRQWRTSTNNQWMQDLDPELGIANENGYEFLFQKELRASDVSSLGRIVLPKKDAERHLPFLIVREGVMITLEDYHSGTFWTARFRFWPNNKSRMYLLENIGGFVTFHRLQEGDLLLCYRNAQGGYVIRGQKVPPSGKAPAKVLSSKGAQARENTRTTEMKTVMPPTPQFMEGDQSTTGTDSSDLANSLFDSLECMLGETGDGKDFEDGCSPQQSCVAQQEGYLLNYEEDVLKTGCPTSYKPLLLPDTRFDPVVAMLSVNVKQRYADGGEFLEE